MHFKSILVNQELYVSVCPPGSFIDLSNSGACVICPADTFSTQTNSGSCTNCPSHTNTQQQTGQTSLSACGQFINLIFHLSFVGNL